MNARRLLESYDPAVRDRLRIRPEEADDPPALAAAARELPDPAWTLLDQVLLVTAPGEPVPDRLRERILREGEALWCCGALLPRASVSPGATILPFHYAGSCRLNPALKLRPFDRVPAVEARAAFPPSDTAWDAIVVAAALEANPGTLTQDGSLRKDVERRLFAALGDEADREGRWGLALRYARMAALLRLQGGRLTGFPEAPARPIVDPAGLCPDPASATVAAALLRLSRADWLPVDAVRAGIDPATLGLDAAAWPTLFTRALDVLHRAGVLDLAEEGHQPVAFRNAGPRPALPGGFMLASDGEILVHVGELRPEHYGRLCRLAPFVEGGALRRHRLSAAGASADVAAGHSDTAGFLAGHSRTGLPPHVRDLLDGWQRTATRITVLTGVDILEHADGRLSIATALPPGARVWEPARDGRGRFFVDGPDLVVPTAADALPVRAALRVVAEEIGQADGLRRFRPSRRPLAHPERVIARLTSFYGGELPGELEALILSGTPANQPRQRPTAVITVPARVLAALRRDPTTARLTRVIGPEELLVEEADLPRVNERLRALGFGR